jgi:SAM-dependent methyltransferase
VVAAGYATDAAASRYEAKSRKGPLRRLSARREAALVARALRGLPPGARVLDVPCGAGRLLSVAAAGGRRAIGADFAAPMLALARRAGAPVVRASATALPLADRAVDAVVCVRLLHHYGADDRARILAEIRRVIRDRALLTVFDARSFKHRRRLRRERRRARPSLRYGVRIGDFLDELRAAGLAPGRVRRLVPGYAELTFVEARRAEAVTRP